MGDDKTINDIYDLLIGSLPQLETDVSNLKTEVGSLKRTAEDSQRALRGSENNSGLVHEVRSLKKSQSEIRKMVADHDLLLYKGKSEKEPSLVSQVRLLRAWQKGLQYWYLLFIAAIVIGLLDIAIRFLYP